MSMINHILNMGARALHAQQMGMSVTSHNVSNANTPGYSRQRLALETARPVDFNPGQIGYGVQAASIDRVYDQFLGIQLQGETSEQGSLEVQKRAYEQLEAIFSGISEQDLASELQAFWAAWEDLSIHPEGSPERIALREMGGQLAQRIRVLRENIETLQEQMDRSIPITVERVNELSAQIAELNSEIARAEIVGQHPNDLQDMRDKHLEELAGLMDIQSVETDDGMVMVSGPRGLPLVVGIESWSLSASREVDTTDNRLKWNVVWSGDEDITDDIQSGSIGGYLEMREQNIQERIDTLDDWAQELIWAVNLEHMNSFALGSTLPSTMTSRTSVDVASALTGQDISFADKINTGAGQEIHFWLYDDADPPNSTEIVLTVDIDDTTTLTDLASDIDGDADLEASVDAGDGTLTVSLAATSSYTRFAISQDDTNIFAVIGLTHNYEFFSGSDAQDIDVATAIQQDADLIGAARVDYDGDLTGTAGTIAPGDNRGALAVVDLRDQAVVGDDASSLKTLDEVYATLVAELGVEASGVYRTSEYQEMVLQQLHDYQASLSGVNLDEEMINLMKYQAAYEAAARLLAVGNDMLQTILELV